MLDSGNYTDWCDTIIGAEDDKYRKIELGTEYFYSKGYYKPDRAVKRSCIGKTLLQIFVPTDIFTECGNVFENGLTACCVHGIIFAFEDGMAEFNYGTMRWADRRIEDFPEVPTKLSDYCAFKCYRPLEHYVTLDYKGQTVTDCGFVRIGKDEDYDGQDSEMFGDDMFVSLSGGKIFYLRSGECEVSIKLENENSERGF